MADIKISDAADPGTLLTTDRFPIARLGSTMAYAGSMESVLTLVNEAIYRGVWRPGTNSPDISSGDTLDGANYIAITTDPTVPEAAPSTIPGLANIMIRNGDRVIWASALGVWQRMPGGTLQNPVTVQYTTISGGSWAPLGFNMYASGANWHSVAAGPVALWQLSGSTGALQLWQGTAAAANVSPTLTATMEVDPSGDTTLFSGGLHARGSRVLSTGSGNLPSVVCYDTSGTALAAGMWVTSASKALIFGSTDGTGVALAQQMEIDLTGGNLTIQGATATKPGGGSWTAPSDERIKRDVEPYTSGLAEVIALEPVSYCYSGTYDDGQRYIGLTAQQARQAMPELVTTLPTGMLGVDAGPLLMAVVNAVRELSERVAALER